MAPISGISSEQLPPALAQLAKSRGLKRIMHVTEAPLGGVVAYLEEMIAGQIEVEGLEIDLITPEINLSALRHLEAPNLRFHLLPGAQERGAMQLLRLGRFVVKKAWERRPQILHVHSTIAGAVVRGLRRFLPPETIVIYCPHGWAFSREGSEVTRKAVQAVERRLARSCDSIICISPHEQQEAIVAGLPADMLTVIENGVSQRSRPSPPYRPPSRPRRIIFAGRFDRQKGFDTFLEVMRHLGPEAEGVAIGRQIISTEDLPPIPSNVVITGWLPRDEVYALYADVDLLLMPSRWEGFGLVAVEAMQAKVPVFASNVGGLRGIVEDGVTGRLFAPDDPAAVIAMIRETSDACLRGFGEAGYRRYLAQFTAKRMNARMIAHYAELMKRKVKGKAPDQKTGGQRETGFKPRLRG